MIRSMTAYASREIKNSWGRAIWEVRSVNHRYLEINFHIPEKFRNIEECIRKQIYARLTRGKIECDLYFDSNFYTQEEININQKLIKQLIKALNWIKLQSKRGEINPIDLLRWPGVILAREQNINAISTDIISEFDYVMDDLIIARKTDGQLLKSIIEHRLKAISAELAKVRAYMPEILQWQSDRLAIKLQKAGIQLENNRLEQELIILAQRTDIAEELDNLEIYIQETYNILKQNNAVGRRLDFMMQEFNRESNTLASKSINSDITKSAIELKVLIEQIREQIQNIE